MRYCFEEIEKTKVIRNHLHMGGSSPTGEKIGVTSLFLERNGRPWIPIMGEFHFCRYDRKQWQQELCKMKAGGITLVATYLFMIYHQETEGKFDFTGNNDIRAFVQECREAGLEVLLRIGPWVHGECRNGGFPDWLVHKPFPLRENHPEYLAVVRSWYQAIAEQVKGLLYRDGGNIVGIQLENEYVHNASHLARLKEIALECGLEVPLYTVTGWGSASGAEIPVDEVLPVFGGYCEAPWEEHLEKSEPSVHYFFSRMRNDSAIGKDLMATVPQDVGRFGENLQHKGAWRLPYEKYPFATCEIGGGIQITHHRRPIIKPMDVYAIALVKLGVGNNLPGYYMYHGGSNRLGKYSTLQESKESGYPNDYPILSYDFQAPLSEYGEVRGQYRLLNLLHLFLQDFQESFAQMRAADARQSIAREDIASLRLGMRTDGDGGYVFVNHYQRLTKLKDVKGAVIDTGSVVFPPIDVCGEISFFLPFSMQLGEKELQYATAQPLCRIDNTYFFVEIPGIPASYCFADGFAKEVRAGLDSVFERGNIRIVTLTFEQACYARKLGGILYLGNGADLYQYDGKLCQAAIGEHTCYVWEQDRFQSFIMKKECSEPMVFREELTEAPFTPSFGEELRLGGERCLRWQKMSVQGTEGFVSIEEVYDAAQIYADGKLITDNFYYGKPWRVPAYLLAGRECYLVMSELKNDFYREF